MNANSLVVKRDKVQQGLLSFLGSLIEGMERSLGEVIGVVEESVARAESCKE